MVGRVIPAVIPPGQGGEPPLDDNEPVESCFSHSIRPRSVSMTKTLSELPPTKARERNPRKPIRRSSRDGGVNEFNCLGSLLSLSFQRNLNPGFCMLSIEIFGSVLIQDERCASPLSVIHS